MLPGRLADMPPSPFTLLNELIKGIEPGAPPVMLHLGEPQDPAPAFIAEIVNRESKGFSKYPPIAGSLELRAACAGWLQRRFHLPASAIDAEAQILPLIGSREGLFYAPFTLVPESKGGGRPVILVPNPYYSSYPSSVLAAGAEPYYVSSKAATGFLPDFASVPEAILKRTVAAFFCSPSNPEGACASEQDWKRLFALADAYDFTVLADECYTEIYEHDAPIGALAVRYATHGNFDRVLSFHSLSKRSNLPGLRSGFVVGSPEAIAKLRQLRNSAGPQMPTPLIAASAAAWNDDAHVEANRAVYRERFAIARKILGNRAGAHIGKGAFYVYLDAGDGPAAARLLWQKAGIKTLPAGFMAKEEVPGKTQSNPGFPYLRIALVHNSLTIGRALERVAEILS